MADPKEIQRLLSALGNDPYAQALYNAAKAAANVAQQNTMEALASRGILNSTITADRIAQVQAQAMADLLPKLYAIKEARDRAEEERRRWEAQMAAAERRFQQELGLRLQQLAMQRELAQAKLMQDLYPQLQEQKIMDIINKNLWRREYFRSNKDFLAQLARPEEGIMQQIGPQGWEYLQQQLKVLYPDDQPGAAYLRKRQKQQGSSWWDDFKRGISQRLKEWAKIAAKYNQPLGPWQ